MKKETYFNGEHFEGMGNIWGGLVGKSEYFLKDLPDSIKIAELAFVNKKQNILGLLDQRNKDINLMHLLEIKENANEYCSACPIAKGNEIELTLQEFFVWSNNVEGEFAASNNNDFTFCFQDPQYVEDIEKFKEGKKQKVVLYAVAYYIEKIQEQKFPLNKGAFYEFQLNEFLKENPNKTENDFEAPIVSLDAEYFRMWNYSDEYACEYQIAGQIKNIKESELCGQTIYKLSVNVGDEEAPYLSDIDIYVAKENVSEKLELKINEGIITTIKLLGYFED